MINEDFVYPEMDDNDEDFLPPQRQRPPKRKREEKPRPKVPKKKRTVLLPQQPSVPAPSSVFDFVEDDLQPPAPKKRPVLSNASEIKAEPPLKMEILPSFRPFQQRSIRKLPKPQPEVKPEPTTLPSNLPPSPPPLSTKEANFPSPPLPLPTKDVTLPLDLPIENASSSSEVEPEAEYEPVPENKKPDEPIQENKKPDEVLKIFAGRPNISLN